MNETLEGIFKTIKDIPNAIKRMDSNTKKKVYIFLEIIVFFIISMFILKITIFSKINTSQLSDKMIIAAKKYYKDRPEALPEFDKDTSNVSIESLITGGYLKKLSNLLKNSSTTCEGEVTVTNNNNYYLYSTNISCSNKFKTKKLYEELTAAENIVTSGNGLYEIAGNYIYRGDNVDNYIYFAGETWRILKINGDDNSVTLLRINPLEERIVWDDRYNSEKKLKIGINDFTVSRMKDSLNEIWKSNSVFSKKQKAYISTQDLCIGARSKDEIINDGSVECSVKDGVSSITMIKPSDFLSASLDAECASISDKQCGNYNYLTNLKSHYWTLTSDSDTSYYIYSISELPTLTKAKSILSIRLVINLSSEVNYLNGTGTEKNPYKIK